MGKRKNYDDLTLIDAVEKYRVNHDGKLKGNKIAAWARENYPGLEGVPDYAFTRKMFQKNQKTGKIESYLRPCTIRINQINKDREEKANKFNPLLNGCDTHMFLELSERDQLRSIDEARKIISHYSKTSANLLQRNDYLEKKNCEFEDIKDSLIKKVEKAEKDITLLKERITRLAEFIDGEMCDKMLEAMGIADGKLSIKKYIHSLELQEEELTNINSILRKDQGTELDVETDMKKTKNLLIDDLG